MFTEENSREISEKLNEKGRNIYKPEKGMTEEEVAKKGPVENLELNTHYMVLPIVDDPTDSEQIISSMEKNAIKLNRQLPQMQIGGRSYEFIGFTLGDNTVKIHTQIGDHVSYEDFISGLNTLVAYD